MVINSKLIGGATVPPVYEKDKTIGSKQSTLLVLFGQHPEEISPNSRTRSIGTAVTSHQSRQSTHYTTLRSKDFAKVLSTKCTLARARSVPPPRDYYLAKTSAGRT